MCIENNWHDGLTVDRIDHSKDYSPDNCRLITTKQQCRNRRSNVSCGYNSDGKQITRTMTYKPDPKMTARQIEKEQEQCAVIIREAVSDYREQQKPVDDDLNALVLENRKKMKEVTDRITEKYFE